MTRNIGGGKHHLNESAAEPEGGCHPETPLVQPTLAAEGSRVNDKRISWNKPHKSNGAAL